MKRICLLFLTLCLLLCGCGKRNDEQRFRAFSAALAERDTLGFTAELCAKYPDKNVRMTLRFSLQGELQRVTVLKPDIIAGIGAAVRAGETQLEYDDVILDTGPLDAYGLSPLSALPILVDALRGGFPASYWEEDGLTVMSLIRDDRYTVEVWFDADMTPLHAELLSAGAVTVVCDINDWS